MPASQVLLCPHENYNIGLKVSFVQQGLYVYIMNSNYKLSPIEKLHNLSNASACLFFFFQHPNDKYDKAKSKQTLEESI